MAKLFPPWLSVAIRMILGGVLLWASYHKVLHPADFTNVIYHYKVFPSQAINLLVIYVPWIEVFLGLALITGFGHRGASFMAGLLFLSFIAVLSFNLYRDCPTICGCFDTYEAGKSLTDAEKFEEMRKEIRIDVACFALALYTYAGSFVKRGDS